MAPLKPPSPLYPTFTDPLPLLQALSSQTTRSYAAKDVRFGTDGRSAIMAGVDALADAVEVTLGPKGRNVMIEQSFGGPKITKDGVTVAKSIEFKDRAMNLGASLIKSVASTTNDIAGDGTTTATLLTRAILREGLKSVAAGMNPMDLRRGIDAAVSSIVDNLKDRTTNISTAEEIAQVLLPPLLHLPIARASYPATSAVHLPLHIKLTCAMEKYIQYRYGCTIFTMYLESDTQYTLLVYERFRRKNFLCLVEPLRHVHSPPLPTV